MNWIAVLCLAFTIRTCGQTTYDTGTGHGTPNSSLRLLLRRPSILPAATNKSVTA